MAARNDGQLLSDVTSDGSTAAFEELVQRHGSMVLNHALRLLSNRQDAEDAMQAVFLVLWKKAASLRSRHSVAAWLHRTTQNVCRNAQRSRRVRKIKEQSAMQTRQPVPNAQEHWNELRLILDDELDRLPEKYRLPLILFHLEDRPLDEIAQLTNTNSSTISTRLCRGRELLRHRIVRRGITIETAALMAAIGIHAGAANLSAEAVSATAHSASLFATGQAIPTTLVTAQSLALANGALHTLTVAQIKSMSAAVAVALGLGVLLSVLGLPAATAPAADLSAIAAAYAKQDAALESLYVQWRVKAELIGTPADVHKYLGTEYLTESTSTFAFKAAKRYSSSKNAGSYQHLVNLGADGKPEIINVTPGGEWTFNGEAAYMHDGKDPWRDHPAALIDPPDQLKTSDAGYFNHEFLRMNLRACPDAFGVEGDRCDDSLRCLAASGKCRLLPETARVADTECIVLEWQQTVSWALLDHSIRNERMLNRLYCDPNRSFAMVKHERFNLLDEPVLRERTTSSDFVEVADGVWLPQRTVWERCAPPQDTPRALRGVVLSRFVYDVVEMHANDVPDELFTPVIRPGTFVRDSRYLKGGEPISYVIPSDASQLDAVIQAALQSGPALPQPIQPGDALPEPGDNRGRLVLIVNVILLIGVLAVAWFMKRRVSGR